MKSACGLIFPVLGLALMFGCSGAAPAYDGEDTPFFRPSLREELVGRWHFELIPMNAERALGSALSVAIATRHRAEADSSLLPVAGGQVVVWRGLDELIHLEKANVVLSDVLVEPDDFPPSGLHLTEVELALDRPVSGAPEWADDDDTAVLRGEIDLVLHWSVILDDGRVHPLASQRLRDLPIQLELFRVGQGAVGLHLSATRDGLVWSWGSFVELYDLVVDISGIG